MLLTMTPWPPHTSAIHISGVKRPHRELAGQSGKETRDGGKETRDTDSGVASPACALCMTSAVCSQEDEKEM